MSKTTYEEQMVKLCELIEKRFNEVAKKTDMIEKVNEKLRVYLIARHKVPKSLYSISCTGSVHMTLFKYTTIRLFVLGWLANESLKKLVTEREDVDDPERSLTYRLKYAIATINQVQYILNLLDYEGVVVSSPIGQRIYLAYLSRYSSREKRAWTPISTPYVYPGARLILTGTLGCGKTTLAFTSLYSFFRLLDFSDSEARKLTLLFFVNNLKEAVKLLVSADKAAEEGLMVPAVIIDDVGAIMPKYTLVPWASDKETMKLAILFIRYFQISREGIGCKVIISAPNMALRGIRETADSVIEGISVRDDRTYTMWFEFMKFYRPLYRSSRLSLSEEIPSLSRSRILLNVTGTVHPPLVLPRDVNKELTERKLETRKKLVSEMLAVLGGSTEEES
jgi:hypothetical protein